MTARGAVSVQREVIHLFCPGLGGCFTLGDACRPKKEKIR